MQHSLLSSASLSFFLKLKWIRFFDLIKYRKLFILFSILLNPNAPNCLRKRFQFLSDLRGPLGRYTRASSYDLKVPYLQVTQGNTHLSIVLLNSSMTLKSSLLLLLRRHSNFFPLVLNLNYEIYFSHAYSLQSTWRIYCARFGACHVIVNVLHYANHNSSRVV